MQPIAKFATQPALAIGRCSPPNRSTVITSPLSTAPVASAVLSGVDRREFPACDGIITNQRGVAVGIYVADCCAVYIVDPTTPAIGLVHSGRKGTELGVVTNAIRQMIERFGSDPADLVVQISPCIRPPHYEIDFAAEIIQQCRALDVQHIHDSGTCTACDLGRYYSYRAEKGKTGRMLAVLGLDPKIPN